MTRHPNAGRKQSPEQIAKRVEATRKTKEAWSQEQNQLFRDNVSAAMLGKSAWNNGKPATEEMIRKNRESHKGIHAGEKHPMYGKHHTPESRLKNSLAHIGVTQSPELIKKRFDSRAGYSHSTETKSKIGFANSGDKNGMWEGGISREEYPAVFWKKCFKDMIRDRDNRMCQICGTPEMGKALDIHHIDYDKRNVDPGNLISLCHRCHGKTNFNRSKWVAFFDKQNNIPLTGTNA